MPVVTVQPGDVRVRIGEGATILAGLYSAGYAYRIGCRRGGCGVCKVDLVEGSVSYEHVVAPTVLSDAERQGGTALSCRAFPQGDVTVALREENLRRVNPFLAALHRAP